MTGFRSIRWRLQAWYGLLLAVILAGLGGTAYELERERRMEAVDSELQELAGRVANANRPAKRGSPEENKTGQRLLRLSPELAALFGKAGPYYYAIWLHNGPDFTASENAPPDVPEPPDSTGVRARGNFREAFLSPAPRDYIVVGTSVDAIKAGLNRLAWMLAGGGVFIFAVAVLIGGWFVKRSLQPIGAITATAEKIAHGNLSHRIDATETESELGGLATVLNETFARLEAAFARQTRFTADAAHELRTPVTVLLTHTQNALTADDLSAENREALEACQRAAQRMRKLIESLLQLARLDGGKESSQRLPCDLAEIARETMELLEPIAKAKAITVVPDLSPAPFTGDPDLMGQVLTNLLTNAIHYNAENGSVRIATGRKNGSAFCEVSDTGPGIAPEHLPHLFERFYRADKARTAGAGKAGLGLAISRAIVEMHHGTIEVQSRPGQGAAFTVRLPLGQS